MPLDRRNCIAYEEDLSKLPTEYHPAYFENYTRDGCIMECRAKYSFEKCDCLPYYYPQFKEDANCNSTGLQCLATISGKILCIFFAILFI